MTANSAPTTPRNAPDGVRQQANAGPAARRPRFVRAGCMAWGGGHSPCRFAAEGARLLLCARSEGVDQVVRELPQAGTARAMRGDIRDPDFARELVAAARKEHGRLDVLVNNAGILREGLVGMTPVDHMREL